MRMEVIRSRFRHLDSQTMQEITFGILCSGFHFGEACCRSRPHCDHLESDHIHSPRIHRRKIIRQANAIASVLAGEIISLKDDRRIGLIVRI